MGNETGFSISIVGGQDEMDSIVNVVGNSRHIITEGERQPMKVDHPRLSRLRFQLERDRNKGSGSWMVPESLPVATHLFNATLRYEALKDENPYNTKDWHEVEVVMDAPRAEIISITSKPESLKTAEFANPSSKSATYSATISSEVEDSVSSNWSTGGTLTVSQEIEYGFEVKGFKLGGGTTISYSQSWGTGGEKSQTKKIGWTTGVSVELGPGESVIAELSASRGVMKIRLHYVAYLSGTAVFQYKTNVPSLMLPSDRFPPSDGYIRLYLGGILEPVDLPTFLSDVGMSNKIQEWTEDIEFVYFSNSKVTLKDKMTGALKATY